MAISFKHLFQSAKSDSADASLIRPSNWNAEHVLTLATNMLIGRKTAGTGAAEEIDCTAAARAFLAAANVAAENVILDAGRSANVASILAAANSAAVNAILDLARSAPVQALLAATTQGEIQRGLLTAGDIKPWPGHAVPSGWLECYGQAIDRTTYSDLFTNLCKSLSGITISIGANCTVGWPSHGRRVGDWITFSTSSALPTGVAVLTAYFVLATGFTSNSFQIAATPGGAPITTSGSQSGVHTGIFAPWGFGNGTSTFNVPDYRGRTIFGVDNMGDVAANRLTLARPEGLYGILGLSGGEQAHTQTLAELAAHTHTLPIAQTTNVYNSGGHNGVDTASGVTGSTGSSTPSNNMPPAAVARWLIFAGV